MGRASRITALAALLLAANVATAQEPSGAPAFEGYPEAPPFSVAPREGKIRFFPCMRCHQTLQPNPTPRQLNAPHRKEIEHGGGRMWCMACHHVENRDMLRSLLDEQVEYGQTYIVCGTCHATQQRDWYFGGHGKPASGWQGERVQYDCVHCHDPHDPPIKPREPEPPPTPRAGLARQAPHAHAPSAVWERSGQEH